MDVDSIVFFQKRQSRKFSGHPVQNIQATFGTNPYPAVVVFQYAVNTVVPDRFRIMRILAIGHYPVRIVHGQSVMGSEPYHPVTVLEDTFYRIGMQAVPDRYV